jgi:FMN-dependent NADH-azoreductase
MKMKEVLLCTAFGGMCGLLSGYLSWSPTMLSNTTMAAHYLRESWGFLGMGFVGGLTVLYVTR